MSHKEMVLSALEEITGLPQEDFEADMDFALLANEILDSVSCASLGVELEDRLGRKFHSDKMTASDFATPNAILAAVEKML